MILIHSFAQPSQCSDVTSRSISSFPTSMTLSYFLVPYQGFSLLVLSCSPPRECRESVGPKIVDHRWSSVSIAAREYIKEVHVHVPYISGTRPSWARSDSGYRSSSVESCPAIENSSGHKSRAINRVRAYVGLRIDTLRRRKRGRRGTRAAPAISWDSSSFWLSQGMYVASSLQSL